MSPSTRLRLSLGIIVVSAVYAVFVVRNPTTAAAIAAGYTAVVLTIFIVVNVWKKPHG